MRSGAQPPIGSTWQLGSVSEPRPPVGCSPRVRPFPPRPPPEVASLCSVASSVLRPHPTSHPRTCSAKGPEKRGTDYVAIFVRQLGGTIATSGPEGAGTIVRIRLPLLLVPPGGAERAAA